MAVFKLQLSVYTGDDAALWALCDYVEHAIKQTGVQHSSVELHKLHSGCIDKWVTYPRSAAEALDAAKREEERRKRVNTVLQLEADLAAARKALEELS